MSPSTRSSSTWTEITDVESLTDVDIAWAGPSYADGLHRVPVA